MMFWYDHDVGGWGWFAMSVGMILFWGLIITGAVMLFRSLGNRSEQPQRPVPPSAEQVLAERFARGEIDDEEYRRRLDTLHSAGPPRS
ncbi:SHOCT domain-containing protein [Streptomyces sp. F63]|uniref:SHOCT domain-containing protein n=1 Tax=Streptomyces sp. F63 TaxID=2824887 RepID=UPI001B3716F4|nr:SHOCT domain-containing protein [Streptomyces sp. F63]MBQ0983192.1 SHOCT domain-containing protein [Streptomyces sp. F63]